MGLVCTTKMDQPKFGELARKFGGDFIVGAMAAHDTWVLRVLEYFGKFHRVATGRSRAGWFRYMDSKGYDYYRSLPAVEPRGKRSKDETELGRAEGDFIEHPFNTTIINNVKYVEPMNRRYGLFGFANMTSGKMKLGSEGIRLEEKLPIFQRYGEENFQKFMENAEKAFNAAEKFKPGIIAPVQNEPPMTE